MRRITLLCMFFIACLGWQAHAQFTESFDTEIPSTWTVVDQDAQGNTWVYSTVAPYMGAGGVRLQWESSAHEDYLISPQIMVSTGVSDKVSFFAGGTGTTFPESFDVKLSTTGTAPSDFTVLLGSESTNLDAELGNFLEYTYFLPAYNGQNVYIAIVGTSTDEFYLYVDEFSISTAPTCVPPTILTATNLTISSADLGWTENGSATMWDIEVGTAGFTSTGTPTNAGVTTNPYPVSVAPSTSYSFYVRADCGGGDISGWTGPYTFTTPCTTFTAPWTEDFSNGGSIPNCWVQGGANAENWIFDTTGGHVGNAGDFSGTTSGSGGHFAYVDDSSPDNLGTTLVTPLVDVSGLTTPALSFYTISNNEGHSNVSFSVDFFDGNSWNTDVSTGSSNTGGWIRVYIDLSSYTITGAVQARFIVNEDNASGDFYDDRAIDDVSFDELPTCQQPTDLTAGSFTTTSAELGWTEVGSATMWDIEVVEGGATPTGIPTEENVGTNPYLYTNLLPSSDYEFYVRADCGAGDESYWTGPYAFSTNCDIVSSPFTQGFETTDVGDVTTCWSIINQGGSDAWAVSDIGTGAYDGTKVMYISWDSSPGHDDYLITPQMLVTAGSTDRFTFHASSASTTYQEVFNVLVSTTGTNVADFTLIEGPVNAQQTGYSEHIYDLSAYAGQNIYIAIQVISDNQLHLYIDGVVLDAFPSCPKPTSLTATGITATGADLGWTESGSATTWDIEVVEAGTTPTGTPTYAGVTTNPYPASGLDPAIDYEFYVRADCGSGDLSEWSLPYAFTTLCATFVPDYTQNFDTYLPNCWDEAGSGTPVTGPSGFGSSSWLADEFLNTGTNMAVNINLYYTGKEEWLISPSIDLSGGANELSYMVATTDWNNSDPIEGGGIMGSDDEVQVLISEDDGITWANLMTYNAANTPSNTGDLATIDLSTYTGTVKIAFWATEGTVNDVPDYDFFVDDFAVTAIGGGTNEGNCSQMQVSNNFENGYGIDEGGGFMVAHDFIVSSSTTNFSVENITGNFFVNGGIASIDILFYEDNAGLPGVQIGTTIEDVVPTSQTVIGAAFGFDAYEVSLDLPTPVDFAGSGTSDDVTYWLQLVAVPTVSAPVYWEITTVGVIGESGAFSADSPIVWGHDSTNPDGVFTISGVCTYVDCPAPINLMATVTSTSSVDVTWTEVGSATEWEVEYGDTGFTPGTGTIVADNDGTLGITLATLTAGTQYEYYVTSVCSGGQSFATGPASFSTPVCDPSSQCDYTFTLTDTFGDGWNGAAMEVRQNGITIATLELISGDLLDVSVPICDGIDFELYWTVPGAFDNEVGVTITNPFGIPIFTMAPGTVVAPASVYTGTGSCAAPTCQQPLNLAVTNTGPNTADLSWDVVTDATNGYVWYVFADGADPTTATPVSTGSVGMGVTTAQATGLTPITPYDFYVEADCDANGMSDLSGPISFQTQVAPPICGGDFYDTGGPAGNYELNANSTVIITPTTSGDVVTVTFTAFEVEAGWDALYVYDGPDATFPQIGSGNPATIGGFPAGGYYGTNLPGPFTSSDSSGALTFVFRSDGSVAQAGWEADVTCGQPIACPAPTDLDVNGIGEDSATVTWTPEGSETEWDVEYGDTGFTPGTGAGTIVNVTTTPSTMLAGLSPETTYDVYVTANCGTEMSDPVGPEIFTTTSVTDSQCEQMQVSNNFENGYGIDEGGGFVVAHDFIVSSSTTNFSVENITGNFFVNGGIASIDILFYEDNAGLPGVQIGTTIEDVVPTSQTVIGTAFGFDAYEVSLDLPTPVDFVGSGTSDDVTYWLQLVAVPTVSAPVYWEITTVGVIGESGAFSADSPIVWGHDSTNPDGVFTISGVCTYVDCPAPINLMATVTSTSSVDVTWTEVGSATEWEVEYGDTGFTPGTGTIVADNDGTLGITLATLTAGTQYEYYVTSVCSGGQSFATGPASFSTPVCDPSSQCDYTFTLTDTFGDGWNGAAMEVRQNGITIATLELISGDLLDVSVPICDGIDFELYWTVPGAFDNEVGVTITNPFGIPIFTMAPGTVVAPASVYTGTGSCAAPTCQQPLNLAVTNTGPNTADLSWDVVTDATNGYVWYVFADGADPTTATPVSTGSVGMGVTTAQATGLTPITPYDFYVEADCDANGMSDLSGPTSFETEVAPPVCGGNFYDTGGPTGDYEMNANSTTIITPTTSGDVVTVTFTAFEVEGGSGFAFDALYVYDGPDNTYPLIDSGNPMTNSGFPAGGYYGTNLPGPFTSSDSSGALTFVFMSDSSVAQAGWEADVTCGQPIACPAPTDLDVNGIGEDSATVTWTPGGSETEWEVEYGDTGFTPGTGAGTIVNVTPNPTTFLSGLSLETAYDVYVTAICDAETSMQVGPFTFSTLGTNGCAFSNPSNAFENGSSNSGAILRIVANDITVPADQNFSLENIVFNEFMSPGVTATTVDIFIYLDNAGMPGTLLTTIPGVVPTSQAVIGDNFGYDASQIVLDIAPFDLDGQVGMDTIYWIGLSVYTSDDTNCFWENTTASIVGAGQAYDDGTGVGYVIDSTLDGVYSFNGICSDLGINDQVFEDFTFYPNPVKSTLSLKASTQIQQVEVFNLLGQLVMKTKPNSMTPTIELSELQAGAYLMKVTINDAVGTYRLIKE